MSSKRDAEQRLIDQNKPLMDLCSKVGHDLYLAEEAKAMWLWVADHAKTINDAKFGKFFGTFQEDELDAARSPASILLRPSAACLK
jgi:hypothetical protein